MQRGDNWNVWAKLKDLKMAIKTWCKQANDIDGFKILEMEKEIEDLENFFDTVANWDVIRPLILKKKSTLWGLYRAEERM